MPIRVNGETADLVLPGVAGPTQATIPAGFSVRDIFVYNVTANTVNGGVKIGTTAGATDVVTALAVVGNAFVQTLPLKRLFSPSADQTLFIDAVVGWNGASVNITITLDRAIP